jgi:hypothetical protein
MEGGNRRRKRMKWANNERGRHALAKRSGTLIYRDQGA